MHRIDGPGATVDNKFTEGDPLGGVQATVVTAPWLNDVQENIIAVLVAGGVSPTKGRAADLLDSLKKVATGRMLRRSVYINTAGTLQVSVNGAAFVTAASTFTPMALTTAVRVVCQGGGGAGGGVGNTAASQVSTGQGGASGALAEGFYTSGFSGASVVVGAGGAGVANAAGNTGLSSGFGALCSAPGGSGGGAGGSQVPPNVVGNNGGSAVATGGNVFNGAGQPGDHGRSFNATGYTSGAGAPSIFGAGGRSVGTTNSSGQPAIGYGAGGSGACNGSGSNLNLAGGDGKAGILIIEEYAF